MPNIWSTEDYIYQSTLSGVNVYDSETEAMIWLVGYAAGVNSVWADDTYVYLGTTDSGVYRCTISTISGVQDTHQYLSEPDITNNVVNYVHGADDYICVSTVSGVDHINMDTSARSYTDLDYGSSKCFQTSTGRFYYLQDDDMPSNWQYRRTVKLPQPTIKNDTVYVELPYSTYDNQGYGVPASGVGNPYETYLDLNTNKVYKKDLITYSATVFTNDANCSAAENSSNAHKALPPNTDSWGDWNTPDSSWYYDFGPGSGTAVCRVEIKPGSLTSTGYGYDPTQIAGSNDGINYIVLHEQSTTPAKVLHTLDFENATPYRYIRLRSTSTVNILIMELYAYKALVYDWQETEDYKVFPAGESLLHGGEVYTHYANNSGGDPSNMSDGDLTTYCQGMTYLAVDFGAGNEKVVHFMKLCATDANASNRIITDTPDIEGSNDSTDGSDGTWDSLGTIGTTEWKSPNKYPGYCPIFIRVSTTTWSLATSYGVATTWSGNGDASIVFDDDTNTYIDLGQPPTNWLQYEFEEPKYVDRIGFRSLYSSSDQAPRSILFYGSNTGEFSGEEVMIMGSGGSPIQSWRYLYPRKQALRRFKFIRAVSIPGATGNRIAELRYHTRQDSYDYTPYRWYRLSGMTANDNLKLAQWELYESSNLNSFDYSKVNPDGSDIRFKQIPDNSAEMYWQGGDPINNLTDIPHKFEHWTTSGVSYIRTLPPEGTTEFYMYYGNSSAGNSEDINSFTIPYRFDNYDDLYAFNKAPDSSSFITLESNALKIRNDNSAWDCGIMANELMLDRDAFMPSISGSNPRLLFSVSLTQTANSFAGLYRDNETFDRSERDTEVYFYKDSGEPEAYGYLRVTDDQIGTSSLTDYPFEFNTWYDVKIEILKCGSNIFYKKTSDSEWSMVPFEHTCRADVRTLYPGASHYYSTRITYLKDMYVDLSYYDTSILLSEETIDPLVNGIKFIAVYNNTSNWTEATAGHVYIPGDGLILSNVLFNDISVLEGVSRYSSSDNLILLATTGGVIVIEERQNDEENSKFWYYLLE